jgi:hypothetical protein
MGENAHAVKEGVDSFHPKGHSLRPCLRSGPIVEEKGNVKTSQALQAGSE